MYFSVNDFPKMSIVDDGRELQVRDVCKECQGGQSDLMVIQCNASNEHGYAFSSGYINVLSEYYLKTKKHVNVVTIKDFGGEYRDPAR